MGAGLEPEICAERDTRFELDGSAVHGTGALLALCDSSSCLAVDDELGCEGLLGGEAFFFVRDAASGYVAVARDTSTGVDWESVSKDCMDAGMVVERGWVSAGAVVVTIVRGKDLSASSIVSDVLTTILCGARGDAVIL